MGKSADLLIKILSDEIDSNRIKKVDICRKSGISASLLDTYLKKKSVPGLDMADKLAAAIGSDLSEIIKGVYPTHREPTPEEALAVISKAVLDPHLAFERRLTEATKASQGANTGIKAVNTSKPSVAYEPKLQALIDNLAALDEPERSLAIESLSEGLVEFLAGYRGEPLNPEGSNQPLKTKR